jgi:hypothetical protein
MAQRLDASELDLGGGTFAQQAAKHARSTVEVCVDCLPMREARASGRRRGDGTAVWTGGRPCRVTTHHDQSSRLRYAPAVVHEGGLLLVQRISSGVKGTACLGRLRPDRFRPPSHQTGDLALSRSRHATMPSIGGFRWDVPRRSKKCPGVDAGFIAEQQTADRCGRGRQDQAPVSGTSEPEPSSRPASIG